MSERVKCTSIDRLIVLCMSASRVVWQNAGVSPRETKKMLKAFRWHQENRVSTTSSTVFIHESRVREWNLSWAYASRLSQHIVLLVDKCLHELSVISLSFFFFRSSDNYTWSHVVEEVPGCWRIYRNNPDSSWQCGYRTTTQNSRLNVKVHVVQQSNNIHNTHLCGHGYCK